MTWCLWTADSNSTDVPAGLSDWASPPSAAAAAGISPLHQWNDRQNAHIMLSTVERKKGLNVGYSRVATCAFFTNLVRWKFSFENRLVEILRESYDILVCDRCPRRSYWNSIIDCEQARMITRKTFHNRFFANRLTSLITILTVHKDGRGATYRASRNRERNIITASHVLCFSCSSIAVNLRRIMDTIRSISFGAIGRVRLCSRSRFTTWLVNSLHAWKHKHHVYSICRNLYQGTKSLTA